MCALTSSCSNHRDTGSDPRPEPRAGRERLIELAAASGGGDPAEVSLPAPDPSAGDWLRGAGAPAAGLVPATEGLWRDGRSSCDVTTAALEKLGSPTDVLAAASATPDEPTREILVDLHASVVDVLRACDSEPTFEDAVPDFAWQWALADRRLRDLGVDR